MLLILLIVAPLGAAQAQQPERLDGLFGLPWVCGSKAAYKDFLVALSKPRSTEKDRRATDLMNGQCHTVSISTGFVVRAQVDGFTEIEVLDINVLRVPAQVSKGTWWALTSDLVPYRHDR